MLCKTDLVVQHTGVSFLCAVQRKGPLISHISLYASGWLRRGGVWAGDAHPGYQGTVFARDKRSLNTNTKHAMVRLCPSLGFVYPRCRRGALRHINTKSVVVPASTFSDRW
ncbi:hypothetical protein EVAR_2526_1 [Eumeta japonica]|uniref:Uncharacterized protein n=1 Tax=Eumeta variegata TaxID=151549 RepID=A0A4C1SRK9_EUMVA|nr:hypothetical protein EVAR_2526_1 [Eumeta japonica]